MPRPTPKSLSAPCSGLARLPRRWLRATGAATAIEYAMLAALISVVALVAMRSAGVSVNTMFCKSGAALSSTAAATCGGGAAAVVYVAPNFAAKTVASRTVYTAAQQGRTDGVSTYSYTFTDGSYLVWAAGSSQNGESFYFYSQGQTDYYSTPAGGAPYPVSITTVTPNAGVSRETDTVSIASNGVATGTAVVRDWTTGNVISSTAIASTAASYAYITGELAAARNLPNR